MDSSLVPVALCVAAAVVGIVLLIVLGVRSARRERERFQTLCAYAVRQGWLLLDRQATPTAPVGLAEAAKSRRSRLLMVRGRAGFPMWLSWHHWQETSSTSSYNSSTGRYESSSTTTTHNLTRYFLALAGRHPAMSVQRRTKLGGLLKSRRGLGTGDAEFDRAFLVSPKDSVPATRQLTAPMRQALLAGAVPPWSITDGLLVTAYDDVPTLENLEPRAAAIEWLATLLPR